MKYILLFLLFPLSVSAQFCGYVSHANYNLNGVNDVTISGDSVSNITLTNCNRIHIFKVRVQGATGQAIRIIGGSNITIDSSYIENCVQGIYAQSATNVI